MTRTRPPQGFALLGDEPSSSALYQALRESSGAHLVAAAGSPAGESATAGDPDVRQEPDARQESDVRPHAARADWQSLLIDGTVEAAVLFRAREELLDAVRQLAVHGKGVVIDGGARLPSALVAELALLDSEGTADVVPSFEWRARPALQRLRELLAEGRLGRLWTIRIDRTFAAGAGHACDGTSRRGAESGAARDAAGGEFARSRSQDRHHKPGTASEDTRPEEPVASPSALTDAAIEDCLVMDVDVLRWLGGDYSHVTTLRSGASGEGFASQTLQLAGEGLPDATCEYRMAATDAWDCRLQGTGGTVALHVGPEGHRLTLDGEPAAPKPDWEADPARALAVLEKSFRGEGDAPRWSDRVRIDELRAAMKRSLARRRTIDVHFETASERGQFKTHMSAAGCGLLVYTLLGVVMLLFAGAVLDPRDRSQRAAESAGLILTEAEFVPGSAELTDAGRQHIADIARQMPHTSAVVIVESAEDPSGRGPDGTEAARLETVREQLRAAGAEDVGQRTALRPLRGRWFRTAMNIGRVIVFAPLGVFLLLQLLLLITRRP